MKQLILFHGDGATSQDHWLPYIGNHFSKLEWSVVSPDIPNSKKPELKTWLSFVKNQFDMTEETILVGHSSGCPLILSLLEQSEVKIHKVVLVAGFAEDIGWGVKPLLQDTYNWNVIKNNCNKFYFINSDNDPYDCNDAQGRLLLDQLGGTQIIISGAQHFGTKEFNDVCTKFPLLIKLIED